MKISAWHKQQGDIVSWYNPLLSGRMDRVYISKVFTFTPDYEYNIDADEIKRGGTGYKIYENLRNEIDSMFPDYSIYPQYDYAIGFLTRGCIRKCPWCVVPKKEGNIKPYCTWQSIKRHDTNKIVFMDNNVLASEYGIEQMKSMVGKDVRIDFNQGLDARLITDEIAKVLSELKWIRFIRMACDNSEMLPIIEDKIFLLKSKGIKPYRIFVYALIRDVNEAHERISKLIEMGVEPFAQPYRDFETNFVDPHAKRLARWCNRVEIRKSCKFKDYKG